MFDFLKKAFSKPDPEPAPTAAPAKTAAPQPSPAPQPAPAAKPAAAPIAAKTPSAPAAAALPAQSEGDAIKITILDIVPKLPAELAPLPGTTAGGSILVPVAAVLAQLPAGAVKVRFGQVRDAAPPGTFPTAPELAETMIDLPLPKVLASINPALLTRRSGQRKMELSEEIGGVFGPKGKAPSGSHAVSAPAAPGTAAPIAPKPEPAPVAAAPIPAVAPVTPIAPPSAPALPKPSAPPAPKPPTSITQPPSAPKLPASAPLPFASQKPGAPPASAPLPFAQKPAAAPLAPAPAAPISPIASAPAAASAGGGLMLPLSSVSEAWPEPVRQEIAQNNLAGASVALPMNRLDSGMKAGKVTFTWGELSQWLDSPPAAASANRDMLLELPLKVIIPLFMGQRQAGAAQKKVVIGENIPNLFSGLAAAPVQEAAAPKPADSAAPISPINPITETPAPAPASILGEIFSQPAKAEWSPQEIVEKLRTLPGISAALIAMSDGLLVAGELPAPLKSDTLAAFLPQMFGRMNHYATETQLGAISVLAMSAGQNHCAVYKAGALFLAVLGKQGETLPDAALQRVAGELAKRT